jgi:hypothetical protein
VATSELKHCKKNNKRFHEDLKEDMYPTKMDHTHLVSNDYDAAKDEEERPVFIKFSFCILFSRST